MATRSGTATGTGTRTGTETGLIENQRTALG